MSKNRCIIAAIDAEDPDSNLDHQTRLVAAIQAQVKVFRYWCCGKGGHRWDICEEERKLIFVTGVEPKLCVPGRTSDILPGNSVFSLTTAILPNLSNSEPRLVHACVVFRKKNKSFAGMILPYPNKTKKKKKYFLNR